MAVANPAVDPRDRRAIEPLPHGAGSSRGRLALSRLAVMPFDDLGPGEDETLIADLSELVAFTIGHLSGLEVVTATFEARSDPKAPIDFRQVARACNVKVVLAGSASRQRQRLGVSVRLVRARDQAVLWSATYDRYIGEASDVHREIADSIAHELAIFVASCHRSRKPAVAASAEAQEAYVRARYHLDVRTPNSLRQAYPLVLAAIHKAPGYARAYSALADWYLGSALYRHIAAADGMSKARDAALEALRLDPHLPDAYSALGAIALWEWDVPRARGHCETAVRLDPTLASAFKTLARCCLLVENYDEALRYAQTAEQLGGSRRFYIASATVALCAGDYDQCLEKCRVASELSPLPDDPQLLYLQGLARHFAADYSGALEDLQRAACISRIPSVLVGLAVVLTQQRREPELVQQLTADLHALAALGEATPYDFAELHAGGGDAVKAMQYLRRGLSLHLPEMLGVRSDPLFRPLRGSDEFESILQAVGVSG